MDMARLLRVYDPEGATDRFHVMQSATKTVDQRTTRHTRVVTPEGSKQLVKKTIKISLYLLAFIATFTHPVSPIYWPYYASKDRLDMRRTCRRSTTSQREHIRTQRITHIRN